MNGNVLDQVHVPARSETNRRIAEAVGSASCRQIHIFARQLHIGDRGIGGEWNASFGFDDFPRSLTSFFFFFFIFT